MDDNADSGGRIALVTGATGGIGQAIAAALVEAGYLVVAHHVRDHQGAADLMAGLGEANVVPVEADVTDSAAVAAMCADLGSRFGSLDALVNNAGIMEQEPFEGMSEELWGSVLDVNLLGAFRVTSDALPLLRRGVRPVIVNVSSQLAYSGAANAVAYSASKAGLLGFTRALARDLGADIRVNAVAPGPITTPMTEAHATKEWVEEKTSRLVMGRFGKPEEIASVVRFLASDDASYMTGQTVMVNGGGVMP